ncbi:MAG: response regulator [Pseudomonadota bacterium]|nr:response regulator [Pseudomonadota bacterium]
MNAIPLLVVDDNALNARLLSYILAAAGFVVETASDAAQCRALLERYTPRLILMDVQLPGMDGLELTRLLKADPRTRDILVIAVTASAMDGDEKRAMNAGCDGYISKPIDTRNLAGQVRDLIERAARPG